jgi:hypothetical protein
MLEPGPGPKFFLTGDRPQGLTVISRKILITRLLLRNSFPGFNNLTVQLINMHNLKLSNCAGIETFSALSAF